MVMAGHLLRTAINLAWLLSLPGEKIDKVLLKCLTARMIYKSVFSIVRENVFVGKGNFLRISSRTTWVPINTFLGIKWVTRFIQKIAISNNWEGVIYLVNTQNTNMYLCVSEWKKC